MKVTENEDTRLIDEITVKFFDYAPGQWLLENHGALYAEVLNALAPLTDFSIAGFSGDARRLYRCEFYKRGTQIMVGVASDQSLDRAVSLAALQVLDYRDKGGVL